MSAPHSDDAAYAAQLQSQYDAEAAGAPAAAPAEAPRRRASFAERVSTAAAAAPAPAPAPEPKKRAFGIGRRTTPPERARSPSRSPSKPRSPSAPPSPAKPPAPLAKRPSKRELAEASAGARPPLQRNKSFHSHAKRSEEARLVVALAGHPEEADLLSATGLLPGIERLPLLYLLVPPPPHSGQGVLAQALEAGASPDELWNRILVSPSGDPLRAIDGERVGGNAMAELRWRDVLVNGRGALGENALHLCLRQTNVPVLRRLAKLLLTPGGIRGGGPLATAARVQKLANSAYEGAQHRGLSCLHLAVLANDLPILRALLRAGARLDGPVARGHFWYQSGNVYFGGSAIGLAASAGRANALAVLLAQPGAAAAASLADADPFAEAEIDGSRPSLSVRPLCTSGCTPLHCAVLHGRPREFGALIRGGAAPRVRNDWGQTPLVLAAEVGTPAVFCAAVRAAGVLMWDFGRCRRVRYALHEIEPLLSAHNDGFPSVLDELVLNRRADVLALPTPLAVLLHDKWLACGRWAALQHVVGLFLSMVLVLVALALATADQHDERFGPDGGCGPWHTNQTFDAWWTDLGHAMSESFAGRGSAAHRGSAVVVCLLAWSLLKLLLFVLRPLWVVSVPQSAILKLDRARRSQGRVRAALRWLKQRQPHTEATLAFVFVCLVIVSAALDPLIVPWAAAPLHCDIGASGGESAQRLVLGLTALVGVARAAALMTWIIPSFGKMVMRCRALAFGLLVPVAILLLCIVGGFTLALWSAAGVWEGDAAEEEMPPWSTLHGAAVRLALLLFLEGGADAAAGVQGGAPPAAAAILLCFLVPTMALVLLAVLAGALDYDHLHHQGADHASPDASWALHRADRLLRAERCLLGQLLKHRQWKCSSPAHKYVVSEIDKPTHTRGGAAASGVGVDDDGYDRDEDGDGVADGERVQTWFLEVEEVEDGERAGEWLPALPCGLESFLPMVRTSGLHRTGHGVHDDDFHATAVLAPPPPGDDDDDDDGPKGGAPASAPAAAESSWSDRTGHAPVTVAASSGGLTPRSAAATAAAEAATMAVASAMESSVRPLLQSHLEKMSQVASALPAGAESEAEAAAVLSGAPSLRAAVDALSARLDGMAGVGSTGGALSAAQEAQLGIALDGFLKKLVEQQDALLAQAEWPAALLKAHSTGHDMLRTLLGLLQEQLTGSAASYAGSVAGTPSRGLNGGSPARNGFQDRGLFGDERRVGDPPTAGTRVNPQRFGSPRSSAPLAAGVSLRSPRTSDSTFGSRFGSGGRARVYGVGSPGPAYGSAQRL